MADVRLIDANQLGKDIKSTATESYLLGFDAMSEAYLDALGMLNDSETIDPETLRPVAHWKPSVGEWIHVDDNGEVWSEPAVECSKCGGIISESDHSRYVWNYCPVCGSKMEG